MIGAEFVLSAWLVSLGPLAAAQDSSLAAAAAASGRPVECSSRQRRALAKGPSVWELARVPTLETYCDLLARAHSELPTQPDMARRSAEAADKALPGHAAPAIVLARAALAMGALDDAARAFARARSIDPRSVEDPATLHDLARVLRRTGKREEALGVYRALVPRVDLLAGADQRVRVLLEAAHASMEVEGAGGGFPTLGELAAPKPAKDAAKARRSLDEAIAYLREARQRPPTELAAEVLFSLALALDRSGARAEADIVLAEAGRSGSRSRPGSFEYAGAPEERAALEALSLELADRAAAIKAWDAYLAGPGGKGPWAGAARGRAESLRRGGKPGPKARAR